MSLSKSLKKIGKSVVKTVTNNALPAVGSAIGGYFGNPALGYELGSMVNGAVGLGSDSLQSEYNIAAQKELANYNAQMQMQLNKQTQDYNLQMWNLTNQYNSPQAQMLRFAEAGLNPNLVYSLSNTAGSAPNLEAPKFDTGPYNPVDTRYQRAQLQLALAEHKQQVTNQAIENDLKRQQLVLSARAADREDRLADAQIKNLASSLGLRYSINDSKMSYYRDKFAWQKYQDDLDDYYRREQKLPYFGKYWLKKFVPAVYNQKMGRRPMLMDYY